MIKRPRIDEIDGLRAILALWVVACHIFCWCGFAHAAVPQKLSYFWNDFIAGVSPVETFMIISGFAISFLLFHHPESYREFITRRFFRLYPVYIICLFLGLAATYLVPAILQTAQWKDTAYFATVRYNYGCERADMGGHLLWHLTLLNGLIPINLLPGSTDSFLPPAWSITLEWQYYLVAPLLLLIVRSGTGILALTLVSFVGLNYCGSWQNPQMAFLPAQLPLFLIGIGSYHLYAWYCRSQRPRSSLYVIPIAVVLAAALLSHWHHVAISIWAVVFGCAFVQGNDLISRSLLLVRKLVLHPWLQKLGKMSYSIYLLHWPLILIFLSLLLHWDAAISSGLAAVLLFFIGVPLILVASAILHHLVELPGMAYGKKLVGQSKSSVKIAAMA